MSLFTIATIEAWLPELGILNRRQIDVLAGLAPVAQDSGKRRGYRSIQGDRHVLRRSLYMPILSCIRFNPPLREFYMRLKNNGKHSCVTITACMRKLLITMNAMCKNNQPWKIKTIN